MPAFVSWPGHLQPRVVNDALHMVDVMPTLLALAGGKGSPDHPMDGKDMWPTLAQGKPSPNEDVLINAEAFRGAIRKGGRHGLARPRRGTDGLQNSLLEGTGFEPSVPQ